MGTAIGDLLPRKEIELEEFKRKKVAIDAFNTIYQFLTILRGPDGALLTDKQGNVTSHLNGLLTRSLALMSKGIDLVYVFDGEAPTLKQQERARRKAQKQEAQEKYEEAKAKNDLEAMYKYASRTAIITEAIINDAKRLLTLLGIPYVDAASEGEAQAAFMQKQGDVDYVASQDYDALLFGAEKIVRNLAISPRKKHPNAYRYERLKPEFISHHEVLQSLEITHDQLIVLAMLVGTDFNVGGIKGIGPKKALKLVKEYGNDFSSLFKAVKWEETFTYSWEEVFQLFKAMPITEHYTLTWKKPDREGLIQFLCKERDFSEERVQRELKKLDAMEAIKKQKGLQDFF